MPRSGLASAVPERQLAGAGEPRRVRAGVLPVPVNRTRSEVPEAAYPGSPACGLAARVS